MYNLICIKFKTSEGKHIEIEVTINVLLERGYELEGGIRES